MRFWDLIRCRNDVNKLSRHSESQVFYIYDGSL